MCLMENRVFWIAHVTPAFIADARGTTAARVCAHEQLVRAVRIKKRMLKIDHHWHGVAFVERKLIPFDIMLSIFIAIFANKQRAIVQVLAPIFRGPYDFLTVCAQNCEPDRIDFLLAISDRSATIGVGRCADDQMRKTSSANPIRLPINRSAMTLRSSAARAWRLVGLMQTIARGFPFNLSFIIASSQIGDPLSPLKILNNRMLVEHNRRATKNNSSWAFGPRSIAWQARSSRYFHLQRRSHCKGRFDKAGFCSFGRFTWLIRATAGGGFCDCSVFGQGNSQPKPSTALLHFGISLPFCC